VVGSNRFLIELSGSQDNRLKKGQMTARPAQGRRGLAGSVVVGKTIEFVIIPGSSRIPLALDPQD
jgi:hypothetical protein